MQAGFPRPWACVLKLRSARNFWRRRKYWCSDRSNRKGSVLDDQRLFTSSTTAGDGLPVCPRSCHILIQSEGNLSRNVVGKPNRMVHRAFVMRQRIMTKTGETVKTLTDTGFFGLDISTWVPGHPQESVANQRLEDNYSSCCSMVRPMSFVDLHVRATKIQLCSIGLF